MKLLLGIFFCFTSFYISQAQARPLSYTYFSGSIKVSDYIAFSLDACRTSLNNCVISADSCPSRLPLIGQTTYCQVNTKGNSKSPPNSLLNGPISNFSIKASEAPPDDKCLEKAQQPAGNIYSQVHGARDESLTQHDPTILDKEAMKKQRSELNYTSCINECKAVATGGPIREGGSLTFGFEGTHQVYVLIPAIYSGQQCAESDSKEPSAGGTKPSDPKTSAKPQSQNDCPSGSTFGTVNEIPSCVKNAPKPDTEPSKDDGKLCIYNCDKWGIPSTDKPTDGGNGNPDSKPSGGGVTGDGQQDKPMTGGGTAGEKVEAKDEEGNDVSGDNAGFADIEQDSIYKSKYKDVSFGKIWTDKKDALLQTGFIAGITESFPTFQKGGSIPSYSIDFSALGLGRSNLEIDPRVWLFIKACIILTACFTARKIIW
ncbi:hypothetical protein [uncultured Deefgea sp.]|uniref:hypothetical protein n=1 Tax=uncultured Deefgea sp. TaxID=1304914 RepID=UPI00260DD1E0|nr:hypothetical protein [uncultured Deefgea sp.]